MREFQGRSALRRLDRGARLVYSGFVLFTLLGLASSLLLHHDGLGLSGETAAAYWRGDEAGMSYPKSYRQILELTHFHLYTEPLLWLVLAHLYHLGGAAPGLKAVVIGGTLAAIAAQIALPWLVAYGSAAFAVALLPTHLGVAVGFAVMAGSALAEMWRPSPS